MPKAKPKRESPYEQLLRHLQERDCRPLLDSVGLDHSGTSRQTTSVGKSQQPWEVAEEVFQWIDRNFQKENFSEYEEQQVEETLSLEYKFNVSFHPSTKELFGEVEIDPDHIDVSISFELNGKHAGWGIAQELDREQIFQYVVSSRFGESLFLELKTLVQTNLELTTPPHGEIKTAREFAERQARKREQRLKHQFEVKRTGRPARSTTADHRKLLARYLECKQAVDENKNVPEWVGKKLTQGRGRLEPWKIALKWAANELGMKYSLSYLQKILTQAKANPEKLC